MCGLWAVDVCRHAPETTHSATARENMPTDAAASSKRGKRSAHTALDRLSAANSICTSRQRHIGPPLSPVSQPPPRVQSWSPLPVTSVLPAFSKSGMIDSRTGSIDSGKNTHYGYNAIVALFPQAATPTTSVQRGQLPASSLGRLLNPRPRGEKNLASHCSHHGAKATVAGGESGRTTTSHQTLRSFQAAPYHRRNRAPRTRTRASH